MSLPFSPNILRIPKPLQPNTAEVIQEIHDKKNKLLISSPLKKYISHIYYFLALDRCKEH